MTDDAFYHPNRPPAPPGQLRPGERLFEFLHGHDRYLVELREHGAYGVKAQFWQNEEFSSASGSRRARSPCSGPRKSGSFC